MTSVPQSIPNSYRRSSATVAQRAILMPNRGSAFGVTLTEEAAPHLTRKFLFRLQMGLEGRAALEQERLDLCSSDDLVFRMACHILGAA